MPWSCLRFRLCCVLFTRLVRFSKLPSKTVHFPSLNGLTNNRTTWNSSPEVLHTRSMDHFVQHAARDVYVCSIFWNVAQAIRFFVKKASKREPWSPNDVARIYVPMAILVLFIGGCFIFWCIWQCRKFRSKEQQKPHTTSLPLGKARVPGPMTSHATTDMHRNVNPLNSREVAPYPPQPARVCQSRQCTANNNRGSAAVYTTSV